MIVALATVEKVTYHAAEFQNTEFVSTKPKGRLMLVSAAGSVKYSGRNVKFPHLKVSYHILELAMRHRTFLVLPDSQRKGKLQAQRCLVSAEALETSLYSWKWGSYY